VCAFSRFAWGAALLTALAASPLAAADNDAVKVERVEYRGWKNNLRLSNGAVELIVTLDVGPRILSYRFKGGKNVFKEYREQLGKSGEKEWQIRGGHRLWVAPEDRTRTYAPDNGPVEYQRLRGGVIRFTPAPDKEYGIQRQLDVKLEPAGTGVTVIHRLIGRKGVKPPAAIWALTVMAPGGIEVLPLPPKKPHPGSPKNARSAADFAPNLRLVTWPFFDFKDPRWSFGSRYITLRQDARQGPTKIGLTESLGWAAYLNDGLLFVKRFDPKAGKGYPDGGCNYETFTNEDMLEMESLGPLVKLLPGTKTEHTERWQLIKDAKKVVNEDDIDRYLIPRIKLKSE
jgi:hypothetical protein